MKKSVYLNQRVRKDVVKRLRKYEREHKLKGSISSTIELLLNKAYEQASQTNDFLSRITI